jgi:NAD(P)-dependent dehydrogenase (short-subunit alcohol dehydrogenase family)
MKMEKVEGKTAFITGGASGMGLGMAKVFSENGMKIVIADARRDALDEAMKFFRATNRPVHAIKLDVRDRKAYAAAADEAEAQFGKVHVLVNNAGVGSGGRIHDMTFDDWDFSIGINVGGVINGVVTFVPRILKHGEGGHIVSTSSTGGMTAVGGVAAYCCGKFAVAGMMEALATDLQDKNIGCSVFVPGPVRTNLGQSTMALRGPMPDIAPRRPPPQAAQSQNAGQSAPPRPAFDASLFMDPLEIGERVLRGIKRNDLFIHTHPEFKAGMIARNEALLRAIPDEPINEAREQLLRGFGTLLHNPIYDKQTTPKSDLPKH